MKTLIAAACAAVLAASPASAAQWTADAGSQLGFSVVWGGEPLHGTFKKWTASIDFDPADLGRSHVVAVIDMASVATDYPEGDSGLKGALGFAVDKYPTARFATTAIRRLPNGSYIADASLTIRGLTRAVSLPFTLGIAGDHARMSGHTTLLRTDFGVGQGEWAAPEPVAHEVTVTVDLKATKH